MLVLFGTSCQDNWIISCTIKVIGASLFGAASPLQTLV